MPSWPLMRPEVLAQKPCTPKKRTSKHAWIHELSCVLPFYQLLQLNVYFMALWATVADEMVLHIQQEGDPISL